MSVGHLRHEEKTTEELYEVLGEADTSKWYAKPKKLNTSHDIPYAGGSSCDGSELFVDQQLYREVMCDPKVPRHLWVIVKGMTGRQIIALWLEHEGTEISIELGDNPVDVYSGSHGLATCKENEGAERMIGNADRYEDAIKPALKRCLQRSLQKIRAGTFNPPRNLWCGPILDDPDVNDRVLIRGLKAKGVVDAFKLSKADPSVMYRVGGRKCEDCSMFERPRRQLSLCELVSGMVRDNRQCERWVKR